MQSVLIECGTTARSMVNTGIQRVVRNIASRAPQVGEDLGLECVLVQYGPDGFLPVTKAELQPAPVPASGFRARVRRLLILADTWAMTGMGKAFYQLTRPGLRTLFVRLLPGRPQKLQQAETLLNAHGPGAILLLLDSTWDTSMWPAIDRFRAKGGHVCAVLYDLIPFTHPDTCAEGTRLAHTSWWSQAPEHVDSVLCISQSVRNDFLSWQERQSLSRKLAPRQVGYFYLGSELSEQDPHIRLLTEQVPFLMVVGSLEPRKNHGTLLDAFERIWAAGEDVRLAIVGSFGWKGEALMSRIASHPELNRRLFLIRDASDRDLSSLYSATVAVILASYAEGFGLPIVEAFQRGTSVLCSDIPVFREVAGRHALYFDPFDSSSMSQAVLESLRSWRESAEARPRPRRKREWLTWQQSTHQLLSGLNSLAGTGTPQANEPLRAHVESF